MRSRDEPDELFMADIITHLLQQISNLMYARGCFNTLVYAYYVVFVDGVGSWRAHIRIASGSGPVGISSS